MDKQNFFSKDYVFLNKTFKTSNELFDFVGEKMYELGFVKEGYSEALKKREAIYPTALPGPTISVGIPHTDPEFIIKPFIAVIRVNEGIPFIQMGTNDSVIEPKIFFVLGFQKEGAIKYQVKALSLIIDEFIVNNDGAGAQDFMNFENPSDCMEVLLALEKKIVEED